MLIHGFGGDSDNWLFNIEEVAKGRPVYALDLPGHGKSTKSLTDGGLGELSTAVVDLLDEIGAAKAHLVGHSLGAAVAFQALLAIQSGSPLSLVSRRQDWTTGLTLTSFKDSSRRKSARR